MIAIVGLVLLLAAVSVLYLCRLPAGQMSARPEWIDVALALALTSVTGFGMMMIVAGLVNVFL